jgi:hypothetical protein
MAVTSAEDGARGGRSGRPGADLDRLGVVAGRVGRGAGRRAQRQRRRGGLHQPRERRPAQPLGLVQSPGRAVDVHPQAAALDHQQVLVEEQARLTGRRLQRAPGPAHGDGLGAIPAQQHQLLVGRDPEPVVSGGPGHPADRALTVEREPRLAAGQGDTADEGRLLVGGVELREANLQRGRALRHSLEGASLSHRQGCRAPVGLARSRPPALEKRQRWRARGRSGP